MDQKTHRYYRENAKSVFDRYDSIEKGMSVYFDKVFEPGERVLDVGCGSGRDLKRLLKMGVDGYGLEPCREFIDLAVEKDPGLKKRIFQGNVPGDMGKAGTGYDGIVCSAVLMHIPEEELFDTVYAFRSLLKDQGKLLVSVPSQRADVDGNRDVNGRLMIIRDPWEVRLLFERIGFVLNDYFENDDAYDRDIKWTTFYFNFDKGTVLKPIDKIESILNRDAKFATYKFALFRALCDIAMTRYRQVQWEGDNKVSVSVDTVARLWVEYYWPIFESRDFVPQQFGETEESEKGISFRNEMNDLIGVYSQSGGLSGFVSGVKSQRKGSRDIYFKKALSKVKNAIIKGPVVYTGGSINDQVFNYDPKSKRINFSAGLWRELVLMGHWIRDSLILRWGEITASMSNQVLKPSQVIDLLLTAPESERDVLAARKVYTNIADKECVWTGKSLKTDFDVDHAIPFVLWKNNDLWNLFPADKNTNIRKSDKLPSRELIQKRKDPIIHYWEIMREAFQPRFDFETQKFNTYQDPDPKNWQNQLFAKFREAIEYTAIQRGWERWR